MKWEEPKPELNIISLGGGVQSSVMVLMTILGDLECPDYAIHADTGWDPYTTMDMVRYLQNVAPYPVHVTQSYMGRLQDAISTPNKTGYFIPIPTRLEGKRMKIRQCTREYKVDPLQRKARQLAGLPPNKKMPEGFICQWLGFSTDEVTRVKQPENSKFTSRFPLIEMDMTRDDCVAYWNKNAPEDAPPLARSSCVGCPFHSKAEWMYLYENHYEELEEAGRIEEAMHKREEDFGVAKSYIHSRMIPLMEAIKLDRIDYENNKLELDRNEKHDDLCGESCFT